MRNEFRINYLIFIGAEFNLMSTEDISPLIWAYVGEWGEGMHQWPYPVTALLQNAYNYYWLIGFKKVFEEDVKMNIKKMNENTKL